VLEQLMPPQILKEILYSEEIITLPV